MFSISDIFYKDASIEALINQFNPLSIKRTYDKMDLDENNDVSQAPKRIKTKDVIMKEQIVPPNPIFGINQDKTLAQTANWNSVVKQYNDKSVWKYGDFFCICEQYNGHYIDFVLNKNGVKKQGQFCNQCEHPYEASVYDLQ